MKKLIIVFSTALLFATNWAYSQQKLGHVNSDVIFATFPEAKTASLTFENFAKTKQTEIDKMVNDFQAKLKVAQEKEKTLSEANREKVTKELVLAQTELQNLGSRIEEFRAKLTKDVADKQNELFQPLQKKVNDAISAVAKEKGLAYVFDTSKSQGFNNIAYLDGGEDITASVKSKLGIPVTSKL
ncbi:membrane protein [Chryseobacterium angstadtii]|uniref:Membrane protein n=1 Tax=Chryseobacterium angstadtii TaxID=558151 RepID=A0A0J7IEZ3_9FLAO|nr:OmpH family outer membrane protein [Chryseobacterium angstadtii]KMQ64697.1 membrane protein [Chryseobacterium angstadtii]